MSTDAFDTVLHKRFGSLQKLRFLEMLNLAKISEHSRAFVDTGFASLKEYFFDVGKPCNELSALFPHWLLRMPQS